MTSKTDTVRESLSFTRSLIFYGSGSITPEHETAAKYTEEARAMRKKYYGGRGVKSSELLSVGARGDDGTKGGAGEKAAENSDERKPAAVGADASSSTTMPETPDRQGRTPTVGVSPSPPQLEYVFGNEGVAEIYEASDFRRTNNLITVPSLCTFVEDYKRLEEMASSGAS